MDLEEVLIGEPDVLEYINDFDSSKLPESKSEDIVKSLDKIDEILKTANIEEMINKQRAKGIDQHYYGGRIK